MKKILTVIGLALAAALPAQRAINTQAYWNQTQASYHSQNRSQQPLQGKVKEVQEIANKDTAIYRYNPAGWLIYEKTNNLTVEYQYDSKNQLQSIKKTPANLLSTETWTFTNGRLETIDIASKEGFSVVKKHKYEQPGNKTSVEIGYQYKDGTQKMGSYVERERYECSFNNQKQLQNESSTIKFSSSEQAHASNKMFSYNSAGQLESASIMDACCGSNSCLCLYVGYQYDNKGRLITESLEDNTVRNALWSYGYTKNHQYDDNGNRYSSFFSADALRPRLTHQPPPAIPTASYTYDPQGNWVERWLSEPKSKKRELSASRRIVYY